MRWLASLFRDGLRWVFKNPLLFLLVLIVVAYNRFVPDGLPRLEKIDVTSAPSLLDALIASGHFIFTRSGLVFWLATAAGGAVTMFNTGTMFSVLGRKRNTIRAGLRAVFSFGTLQFLLLEIIIGFASAFLALAVIESVTHLLPGSDMWGVGIIIIAAILSYPIAYMALTVGAIIAATPVSIHEKLSYVRILLSPKNARRLCGFYLVRMSAEVIASYVVLALARHFGISPVLTGISVVLIMTIPLTLLRTTALVMKLQMLRQAVWFRKYFKSYYEQLPSAKPAESGT